MFIFSIYEMFYFLACIIQLIFWSSTVAMILSFNILDCALGLVLLCSFVSSSDALFSVLHLFKQQS